MSYIIGIAGGSGSGKSTFSKRLKDAFPDSVSLISCDNYYLPHDDIPFEEREKLNYDAPEALEFDLMVKQLRSLREGRQVDCPVYDFNLHTRSKETKTIKPKPIIIIDGILIFSNPDLVDIMDMKIFVDADADERALRRLMRDNLERGRSVKSVINQYLGTVKPMHNAYVEPTKAIADITINGGLNDVAFDVVKTKIQSLLSK